MRMIHNVSFYYWRLNCLSGFDFERGKISRRSDFTHCYFYNSLDCKWLECAWYGISRDFKAYFRAPSNIWQSPTVARMYSRHPVMYSRVKTKSAIANMQNVFCSVKARTQTYHKGILSTAQRWILSALQQSSIPCTFAVYGRENHRHWFSGPQVG